MTPRDFCYWLQGIFEVGELKTLNEKQTDLVKRHLNLVFVHSIDPEAGGPEIQAKLNSIHNGTDGSELEPYIIDINPKTEWEAIAKWGPKPGPQYKFNMHGWYDPAKGTPRC